MIVHCTSHVNHEGEGIQSTSGRVNGTHLCGEWTGLSQATSHSEILLINAAIMIKICLIIIDSVSNFLYTRMHAYTNMRGLAKWKRN